MIPKIDVKDIESWLLYVNEKEYHDNSLYEQPGNTAFRALIEGVSNAFEDNYDPYEDYASTSGIIDGLYNLVYVPVIKTLIDGNEQLRKTLEEQMKYGTKITVTTEELEKLLNKEKERQCQQG